MAKDQAYYEAEKKIEEARRLGVTTLNLSYANLTELPDSVWQLTQLKSLYLSYNQLTILPESLGNLSELRLLTLFKNRLATLPESLGQLTQLQSLDISNNQLVALPKSIERLTQLQELTFSHNMLEVLPSILINLPVIALAWNLDFSFNKLVELPDWIRQLKQLEKLVLSNNQLTALPEWIGHLAKLKSLDISENKLSTLPKSYNQFATIEISCGNHSFLLRKSTYSNPSFEIIFSDNQLEMLLNSLHQFTLVKQIDVSRDNITDIPVSLAKLEHLEYINLDNNPLNPELAAAYKHGFDAVKAYLRAKIEAEISLNEAKLILVGEGEVGKTCLLAALRGDPFVDGLPTTHGIEIKPMVVIDPKTQREITLNGWDFGGQRVYRPTHQLFFSAPAVYLVVWKPREGSQAGQVKEWIQLVKRREPSAKILVVATHGGPQQRQPDIDRQELWDLFGKDTIVDFLFVNSKPDKCGNRKGIDDLKQAIAQIAVLLPEVGRSVPKSFTDVRQALQDKGVPYLPLQEVINICRSYNMDDEIAKLFIIISHRLGHLTHYENDPILRDVVILRPDWLAAAMSYVLDDEETRQNHGLINFSSLGQLWDDPKRPTDSRYSASLHPIFLRLMERFDLSYRIADPVANREGTAVLRPNTTSLIGQLVPDIRPSNLANAWKTSPAIGDIQQTQICHIVDASNGQSASAEGLFYQLIVRLHKYSLGREYYPNSVHWQRGLVLEDEYKNRALLEHVGNDVRISVRSPFPEGLLGMLTREVKFLVESFWEGLRCDVMVPCLNEPCIGLFEVGKLMENKRRGRPEVPCIVCNEWQDINCLLSNAPAASQAISMDVLAKEFAQVKDSLSEIKTEINVNTKRVLSQVDKTYTDLLQVLTDEAKEGPRLFSFFPVDRSNFNPKEWIRTQFRLVLWCEHSRLPLPVLNNGNMKKGVYDLELDREWFKKSAPYLKFLTGTLGMVLPVASSSIKLALDETAYKLIEEQLDFGKTVIDAAIGESAKVGEFLGTANATNFDHGVAARADGSALRELHALLKAKDLGFGGLVRVMNKRQEFLWVHEKFAGEY